MSISNIWRREPSDSKIKHESGDKIGKISLMFEESFDLAEQQSIHGHCPCEVDGKKKIVFGFGKKIGVLSQKTMKIEYPPKWNDPYAYNNSKRIYNKVRDLKVLKAGKDLYAASCIVVSPNYHYANMNYGSTEYRTFLQFHNITKYDIYKIYKFYVPIPIAAEKIAFIGDKIIFADYLHGFSSSFQKKIFEENSPNYKIGRIVICRRFDLKSSLENYKDNDTNEFRHCRALEHIVGGCRTEIKTLKTLENHVLMGGRDSIVLIDYEQEITTRIINLLYLMQLKTTIFGIDTRINLTTGKETILCGICADLDILKYSQYSTTSIKEEGMILECSIQGEIIKKISLKYFWNLFSSLFYLGNDFLLLGINNLVAPVEKKKYLEGLSSRPLFWKL